MNGSDSERLMAQIEAFLRTGEAPPPAPEPTRTAERGSDPAALDLFDGETSGAWPPIRPPRWWQPGGRLRLHRRGPDRPSGPGRRLRRAAGPVASWRDGRDRAAFPSPPAAAPPRWTPVRVAVVIGLLAALIVVPPLVTGATRPVPAAAARTTRPAAVPGYAFLHATRSGLPWRWNPCTPIHYETSLAGAPPTVSRDLQVAIGMISQATGIVFVDDGAATGAVAPPAAAGSQSAPVGISWAPVDGSSASGGVPAGAAGIPARSLARTDPVAAVDQSTGRGVYVTGSITLDPSSARLPAGFGPGSIGVVLLHELGYLMGLAPVQDPAQIMYTAVLPNRDGILGAGDLAGLAQLGDAQGCVTPPVGGSVAPGV